MLLLADTPLVDIGLAAAAALVLMETPRQRVEPSPFGAAEAVLLALGEPLAHLCMVVLVALALLELNRAVAADVQTQTTPMASMVPLAASL